MESIYWLQIRQLSVPYKARFQETVQFCNAARLRVNHAFRIAWQI